MNKRRIGVYRTRRVIAAFLAAAGLIGIIISNPSSYEQIFEPGTAPDETASAAETPSSTDSSAPLATEVLEQLAIKGRAPKTGYERTQFYSGWLTIEGCSLRQRIIRREIGETAVLSDDQCTVISGEFDEPYTGQHLIFYERSDFTTGIQIDHVVALSDAWQKGAQNLTADERYSLATDPLNLLAVDSSANQKKSDGDAATWLPSNKAFRCQYVARQVSVKYKYNLWVTQAEHDAIANILSTCPNERAVGVGIDQ